MTLSQHWAHGKEECCASELIEQILDDVRRGHDADELAARNDGNGVEAAACEDLRRLTNGAGFRQSDRVFLHDLLQGKGVVQRGVHGALVSVEGIAKADAQDVAPSDDSDELVAADDGDMVDAVLADKGAHLGDRITVVCGDHVAGHDVGDGIVAFHGW